MTKKISAADLCYINPNHSKKGNWKLHVTMTKTKYSYVFNEQCKLWLFILLYIPKAILNFFYVLWNGGLGEYTLPTRYAYKWTMHESERWCGDDIFRRADEIWTKNLSPLQRAIEKYQMGEVISTPKKISFADMCYINPRHSKKNGWKTCVTMAKTKQGYMFVEQRKMWLFVLAYVPMAISNFFHALWHGGLKEYTSPIRYSDEWPMYEFHRVGCEDVFKRADEIWERA